MSLFPPAESQLTWLSLFLLCKSPASNHPIQFNQFCGAPVLAMEKAVTGQSLSHSPDTSCCLQQPLWSGPSEQLRTPLSTLSWLLSCSHNICFNIYLSLSSHNSPHPIAPLVPIDDFALKKNNRSHFTWLLILLKNNMIILQFFLYSHLCGRNQSYSQIIHEPSLLFRVFLSIPIALNTIAIFWCYLHFHPQNIFLLCSRFVNGLLYVSKWMPHRSLKCNVAKPNSTSALCESWITTETMPCPGDPTFSLPILWGLPHKALRLPSGWDSSQNTSSQVP